MKKLEKAVQETGITHVAISGGVSANSAIRKRLLAYQKLGWKTYIPKISYTTDNAAMIAMVGQLKYERALYASENSHAEARFGLDKN